MINISFELKNTCGAKIVVEYTLLDRRELDTNQEMGKVPRHVSNQPVGTFLDSTIITRVCNEQMMQTNGRVF